MRNGASPKKALKKTTSRRRRRRRKASSLLEMSEEDRNAEKLEAKKEAIETRLQELEEEEADFLDDLTDAMEDASIASEQLAAWEAKAEEIMAKIEGLDADEAAKVLADEEAEARSDEAAQRLESLEDEIGNATKALDAADADMGSVEAELAAQTSSQLQIQTSLIELVQKTQHLRHEELKMAHSEAGQKVLKLDTLLDAKKGMLHSRERGEECDELRAQVITAKAKLDKAADALQNCLQAKKDIQAKIDQVEKLSAKAKAALADCLTTKARLKTAVDECHKRRDSARQKLKECLDRKKELKVKIEACHKKRDEARAKLDQCLKAKKTLKEKIDKAKASLGKKSSLVEVVDSEGPTEEPEGPTEKVDEEEMPEGGQT